MSLRSWTTRILGAGLLICLAAGSSRADVLVQTFSLPLTQTNWDTTTPAFNGANPFQVQEFDGTAHPLYGSPSTLQSVTLKMDYEFDNTLKSTFANPSTITVSAHGNLSLTVPGVTGLTGSFDRTGSATATDADTFPKTVDLGLQVKTDSKTVTYTDSSTLSKFMGTGVISVPAVATATSDFTSSSGNGFGGSRTFASVTFTVTYTYVPEPGSFVLMGLGGIGLFVVNRRRSRLAAKSMACDDESSLAV